MSRPSKNSTLTIYTKSAMFGSFSICSEFYTTKFTATGDLLPTNALYFFDDVLTGFASTDSRLTPRPSEQES